MSQQTSVNASPNNNSSSNDQDTTMIGEDESHSNKRSRYDDDLTSYLRNRTHDDNGVAIPTQKSAPSAKYLKLLAQENERDRKYGKKPKNLTERIKRFIDEEVEPLQQPFRDPYKDLAVDMHKLTHQIDTKETSTSKMDPKDPATFPRSIKLDIELGAPDSHKEKEEFRELSENFKAVKLKFQEDICTMFIQNARNVLQTLCATYAKVSQRIL